MSVLFLRDLLLVEDLEVLLLQPDVDNVDILPQGEVVMEDDFLRLEEVGVGVVQEDLEVDIVVDLDLGMEGVTPIVLGREVEALIGILEEIVAEEDEVRVIVVILVGVLLLLLEEGVELGVEVLYLDGGGIGVPVEAAVHLEIALLLDRNHWFVQLLFQYQFLLNIGILFP
jgi:hypothetical protein